jgi:hypothetical protein
LVPLTAGACSPRRRSSRRIPRQTSGPDSSPRDGRGAASRRHRAPPEPDPKPLPDGRPLGSLGEAALSCRCIDSQPTWVAAGRASTSGPGVGASIEPSSAWTTATAVAVNTQYGQPCPTVAGPMSVGRRTASATRSGLATLHKCSLAWPGSQRERLFWVVCGHTSWLLSSGPAAGRADVKGPSPRPFRHGGILHGSTS